MQEANKGLFLCCKPVFLNLGPWIWMGKNYNRIFPDL